jgi:PPK2 family polyphosphate:nucleotide phosphotransferase
MEHGVGLDLLFIVVRHLLAAKPDGTAVTWAWMLSHSGLFLPIPLFSSFIVKVGRIAQSTCGRCLPGQTISTFSKQLTKMVASDDVIDLWRVPHGKSIRLKDYNPGWAGDPTLPKEKRKQFAEQVLSQDVSALAAAQDRLYAADRWSILIIFQAVDAAGKDSTIKHVMSGINPQGCQVVSFKQPSTEELDHNFLWRYWRAVPERGRIGIFNRSYYEEVLVVRVHPELLQAERIANAKVDDDFWSDRFADINAFERHLSRNGTMILKFFLYLSKDEQRKRLLKRLKDPTKHWKFSAADVAERGFWDDYIKAFEDAISATSTKWAPWYVIPADHKWVSRALVSRILTNAMESLDLKYPDVTDEQRGAIAEAKKHLQTETKG